MAFLRDLSDALGRLHELGERTTLGREPGNTIEIRDSRVSRRHATIARAEEGGFVVTDLGSTHGTWIGGRRVGSAKLADGDEIVFGRYAFRFEVNAVTEPPRHTAPGMALPFDGRMSAVEPRFLPVEQIHDQHLLRRDYEKLRAAYELSRSLGVEHDLDAMLHRILDVTLKLLGADRGAILLHDAATGLTQRRLARDRAGVWNDPTLSVTVINEAVSSRSGVLSADAGLDHRFRGSQSVTSVCLRSTMCAPMLYLDDVIGTIYLDSREADQFGEKDLELLASIAGQAALAIRAATLRARIRDAVAEERRRLQVIVAKLPTALILLDHDRRIALTNDAADRLLPLLSTARAGDVLSRLGNCTIDELLDGGADGHREIEIAGPPWRDLLVSIAGTHEGDAAEIVLLLHDITEERRREAAAAREDRMALVGQLAGGIAHDFNNLLGVILSYADFLRQELPDPGQRADAEAIAEAGQRATALVRQLMLFARREPEKSQDVDINSVVAGMEMLVRRTLGAQIRLRFELEPALRSVQADTGKLEQVIMNLVVNARDAMESGGELTITTANLDWAGDAPFLGESLAAGRYVLLRVRDTGTGMTPEVAARAFEPFFSTKGPAHGTGLGLATVYGIVRQAGGRIGIDSAPGRGSVFEICLPAIAAHPAAAAEDAGVEDGFVAGEGLILVVEDEAAMRDITCRMLRRSGYEILEAEDGAQALSLCEEHHPRIRLVLTDVIMPDVSGKQLGHHISRRWPGLPVVFMTGYSFDQSVFEGAARGLPRVIQKPFTQSQLLAEVQGAIEERAAPRDG